MRILCPNCHSQTPTYSGRNCKNKKQPSQKKEKIPKKEEFKPKYQCKGCLKQINKDNKTSLCYDCLQDNKKEKRLAVIEKIKLLIGQEPLEKISARLGMSSRNLSKILKRENIEYPKNDYWGNIHAKEYSENYSGTPNYSRRKHEYEYIFKTYLECNESYAKTAKKLNLSRSSVRDIILTHKFYIKN